MTAEGVEWSARMGEAWFGHVARINEDDFIKSV